MISQNYLNINLVQKIKIVLTKALKNFKIKITSDQRAHEFRKPGCIALLYLAYNLVYIEQACLLQAA